MGIADDILHLDATAQAELIRNREVTAVEVVSAAVQNAERLNPAINAIIHPRYEEAIAESGGALGDGPFAGVPMVVKDLGCPMAGEPMYGGTRALKNIDYRATHDAALWRRFRAAGFIALGRTNTPEWGSTITTEPMSYGPSRNPWNLEYSTGGSSGGSAAAVAAGIVAVGHAGDGGGSIRIPASECGLVGLKPTRARVSMAPDVGESWAGYTTDGAITRSVRDAAAVLDAIAGYEPGDPYMAPPLARPLLQEVGADPGTLRIGVMDRSPNVPSHPDCEAAVAAAATLLSSLGHHIEDAWPTALTDQAMAQRFVTVIAACTAHDTMLLERVLGRPVTDEDLEPDNLFYGAMGNAVTVVDYLEALRLQHEWCREVVRWWHPTDSGRPGFDLLITPVIATPPPPIGYLSGPEGASRVLELLQFTGQFNVTGQPAISLPLYRTADGLPVGVQLVAAYGREDVLVRVAAQIESAAPWPLVAAV